jgi:hypothetical protein
VKWWAWFVAGWMSTFVLGWLQYAAAQPSLSSEHDRASGDESAAYSRVVTQALTAFDEGRYLAARELMGRAHQLSPSARTLRGMGLAAFQAKRYAIAGLDFERALAETRTPLTDEQREEVERLQVEVNALTARYRLTGQRPGAAIRIDAEPPLMDNGGFLVLDAGDHALSLVPAGGDERTMVVHAEGGTWADLNVSALRVSGVVRRPNPWADPQTTSASTDRPTTQRAPQPAARPPLMAAADRPEPEPPVAGAPDSKAGLDDGLHTALVSAAIGGGLIATGFAVWQWRSRESEVDAWNSALCLSSGRSRRANCATHERAYKNAERWTWVAAGTAVLLTGAAITLLLVAGVNDDAAERATTLRCGAGPLAFGCEGRF